MEILNDVKYVLFTFMDGTHFVVRTSLNLTHVPKMEPDHIYDLLTERNIPIAWLETTKREILDEYPEQHRKETEYYAKLLYGIDEVPS